MADLYDYCEKGDLENVKKIVNQSNVNYKNDNYYGWTPLHIASDNGHIDIVKTLLSSGADINVANNDGWTPLFIASTGGLIDIVKTLLSSGANINLANNDGYTPLHMASGESLIDIVKTLLSSGANTNLANNDGWTPLHMASYNGRIEIVKTLLSSGANINIIDNNDGWTPLYMASWKGHIDIVETLLSSDADINIKTNEGKTALEIAKECKKNEIVKLLEEETERRKRKEERIREEEILIKCEEARKEMEKSVEEWKVNTVCYWIKNLNLKNDYSEVFQKNDIGGNVLKNLTQETLEKMGINLIEDLVRLQTNIKELNTKKTNQVSTENSKNTPEEEKKIPNEKNEKEMIIESEVDTNEIIPDLILCFVYTQQTGENTVLNFIGAKDSVKKNYPINIKKIPCPETKNFEFEDWKEDFIPSSSAIVAFLTKDCFKCECFLSALEFALEKKKWIILIHDPLSCGFPKISDLPNFLKESRVFDSIAITFQSQFAVKCWEELIKKFSRINLPIIDENIETDMFLSHKQATGQGIAHTLYISLTEKYKKKVFLDVRTEFDIHNLQKLIEKTKFFIFIMTEGILDSYYCFLEFETAINLKKPILVIHGENFQSVDNLPDDNKWKKYGRILFGRKVLKYESHYHNENVSKLLKKFEKTQKTKSPQN